MSPRPLLALALGATTLAAPLAAQDLTYTTTTRMELAGAMGRMLSMFGNLGDPTVDRTFIKGTRIRTDSGEGSTIMDWDAGTMTVLDHAAKTFMQFDFEQMAQGMAQGMSGAAGSGAWAAQQDAERPEVTYDVSISTDRTGRTEDIAGYEAEQFILTIELEATGVPEGAEDDEAVQAGMAVVTELWLSTEFPQYRMMQEMGGELAERLRESGGAANVGAAMAALSSSDPRMQEGWEANLEAMKELDGFAVRTTMHYVTLPPGVELDREKVLESAGESLSAGAGESAADAAKKALSGLAGRFGRGRQEEEKPEASQVVLMRVVTEIDDVSTDAIDPSAFEVPEGYTERTLPAGREDD